LDGISSNLEDIRQEVATLRLCNHPNVLRFYASFVEQRSKHELWLVTQLLEKGSCLHAMTEAKKMGMPPGMHEDWVVWILRESLNGLRYFHEHQQIHRDIKAGNILLDGKGRVALADFGVSRWINGALNNSSNDGRAKTFVGTPCWMVN
jgi:serine/threonine-protein kinase OSR1/STK39